YLTDNEWLNWDWKRMYEADPCEAIDDDACSTLMLGGEGCMWGENVDTSNILHTIWPRAGAIAERLWSVAEDTADTDDAEPRYAEFRCHLNRRGVAAAPHSGHGPGRANPGPRNAPGGPGGCLEQRR
ncbi:hypothetical protein TeGR_g9289, partial [Tetraparma gracilis]